MICMVGLNLILLADLFTSKTQPLQHMPQLDVLEVYPELLCLVTTLRKDARCPRRLALMHTLSLCVQGARTRTLVKLGRAGE